MKLKDRETLDPERLAALVKLDETTAFSADIMVDVPECHVKGKRYGTRRRVSAGVVAVFTNFDDAMCVFKNELGSGGQWLFKKMLLERYGTAIVDDAYDKFRRETLGNQYEEWT